MLRSSKSQASQINQYPADGGTEKTAPKRIGYDTGGGCGKDRFAVSASDARSFAINHESESV